jgi:hypothetical protein
MPEMPKYLCHKEVWALKISRVETDLEIAEREHRETDGSGVLHFADERYGPRRVDRDYMRKHDPGAGGYFVVYADGYESWSPSKAFEEGYTLVES